MKIALCLHGLFSSENDTSSNGFDGREHIQKNILDKGDVDVFIHSWETDKKDLIEAIYQPKKAIFESQIDFKETIIKNGLDTLVGTPRTPQSVLSHLYSVTEAMKLPYESGVEYDIIIKARFDLGRINRNTSGPGLGNPFAVQCINFQTDIENGKLYNANWNHFNMGPADMWFYGSMGVMKPFTELYQSVLSDMKVGTEFHNFATNIEGNGGDLVHAVAFYKWWLIKNNLWDTRINLDTTWE
jgi:hypothetical protein